MKMSTKGRYGLRVMIELAARHGQGPVGVDTIAKSQGISGKYIHILMGNLRTAGLARAVRGPGGGYELAKPPSSLTALDVVQALEGKSAPVDCVMDAGHCRRAERCPSRQVWCEVGAAVDRVLSRFTLARLAARHRVKARGPADFCI